MTAPTPPTEPEHLDPHHLPPWLLEAAKADNPSAMGWLVSGYLSGVQVGRKSGPCMASLPPLMPGMTTITCELAHGHVGGHSNEKGTKWTDLREPS